MSVQTTPAAVTAGSAPWESSRLARITSALCIAGAGALIFAGFIATPWEGNSTTAAGMRAYLAHPTQAQIAPVLRKLGCLTPLHQHACSAQEAQQLVSRQAAARGG